MTTLSNSPATVAPLLISGLPAGFYFRNTINKLPELKNHQSEQAILSLPLLFCQSTFRISDFRGPQLAET